MTFQKRFLDHCFSFVGFFKTRFFYESLAVLRLSVQNRLALNSQRLLASSLHTVASDLFYLGFSLGISSTLKLISFYTIVVNIVTWIYRSCERIGFCSHFIGSKSLTGHLSQVLQDRICNILSRTCWARAITWCQNVYPFGPQ